jgi:hypothetical protein
MTRWKGLGGAGLAIAVIAGLAWAHGGGLDSQGGHHNRKQGGYHFHQGPLAGHSYSSKEDLYDELTKLVD